MKIAVINFSGNVGKTTISRHLLLPRIAGAELISVESLNADEGQGQSMRGRQFADLQEYMQTVESLVVDIGASNVEDLMALMRRYQGSHEDFDYFVVPTVPELKQQEDTMATLGELARSGIPPSRLKLVFNMVADGVDVDRAFQHLLAFLQRRPVATFSPRCRLGTNEVYGRINGTGVDLATLARDDTDYKALIAKARDTKEKLALAQMLSPAVRRALTVSPPARHRHHGSGATADRPTRLRASALRVWRPPPRRNPAARGRSGGKFMSPSSASSRTR